MRTKALIFTLLCSFGVIAQRSETSNELGFFFGGTNFIGDVGNYGPHLPKGVAGGVFYRHQFNYHYAVRGQLSFGQLANDDAWSTLPDRNYRNLSFRSNIWEGMFLGEVNFFQFVPGSRKYNKTPYIFAGIGITTFNPQAYYEGDWYDLNPLGTEGQRTSVNPGNYYALAAWNLPFGIGYKVNLGRTSVLAFEIGFRRTFTDYLDDVSGDYVDPEIIREVHGDVAAALSNRSDNPDALIGYARGNNNTDDWYVFTGVTLSFDISPFAEKCANFITR